jgi:hypothetical protein
MKVAQRQEARRLRKQGHSLSEISSLTGCSKSSISRWTRDIPLTTSQITKLRRKEEQGRLKGRLAAASHPNSPKQVWGQKREQARQKGREEITQQGTEGLKVLVAALYWGEGGKTQRSSFSISNTDPAMIKLIVGFLRHTCQVPEDRLRFRIHLHPHLSEQRARRYWAKVAETSPKNISVTKSKSSASRGKKDSCPFGTFMVSYHDTLFRSRVEGWMDALKDQMPG